MLGQVYFIHEGATDDVVEETATELRTFVTGPAARSPARMNASVDDVF